MTPTSDWRVLTGQLVILLLSLSFHEAAHAWSAWKLGDPTAKDLGRVSLNPLRHISLIFTIIMPVVTYFAFGFAFGGAKPCPVDFGNLRKPRRDDILVSWAGPVSNVLLACLAGFVMATLIRLEVVEYDSDFQLWDPHPWASFGLYAIFINLVLAAFNALPIPPLDGFSVVRAFLPGRLFWGIRRFEWVGLLVIFALLMSGVFAIEYKTTETVPTDFIASFWNAFYR